MITSIRSHSLSASRNVRLFGGLQVEENGVALAVPGSKAVELFSYLALHAGRPHRREALIDILWPDGSPKRVRALFSNTLYRLRQAIGEGWLEVAGERVAFKLGAGVWVDTLAFEGHCEAGDPDSLKAAAALYLDNLLPELYTDWVVPRRVALQNLFLAALSQLAEAAERRGSNQEAFTYFHRLSLEDPLNEAAHRGLMHVYLQQGRHAAALQQFEKLVQVLRDELQVEPMRETHALADRIRAARAPGPGEPRAIPVLVGRRPERQALLTKVEALSHGIGSVAFLQGAAGLGKTHLLKSLAESATWRGATVVWGSGRTLGPAAPYAPLDQALQAAVTTHKRETLRTKLTPAALEIWDRFVSRLRKGAEMNFRRPPNIGAALSAGFEVLAEFGPHVLILDDIQWAGDDFWDVIQFMERLRSEPFLFVLSYRLDDVRSRPRAWESLQALDRGLSPLHIDLEALSADQCAELATGLGLKIKKSQLSEIVRQTGGNPLYILEMLSSERNDRSHSLNALIQSRIDALDPAARDALESAAVLGRAFSHGSWQAVGGEEILPVLPELIRRRFIQETEEGYLLQHDLTRARIYAGIGLDRRAALHRQTGQILAIEGAEPETLAWHFERGQQWNRAQRNYHRAGRRALRSYAFETALSHLDRAVKLHAKVTARDPYTLLAILLTRQETLGILLKIPAWIADLEAIEELAVQLDDHASLLEAHMARMKLNVLQGNLDVMQQTATRALRLAEQLGDPVLEASLLNEYGWHLSESLGENKAAIAILERGARIAESAAEPHTLVSVLTNLSFAERADGRCRAARESASSALTLTESLPELYPAQAYALKSLAEVNFELAQYETARAAFKSALYRFKELSDPWSVGATYYNYGLCVSAMGQHNEAIRAMQKLVDLGKSVGLSRNSAYGIWHRVGLARVLIGAEDFNAAATLLDSLAPVAGQGGRARLALDSARGWLHLLQGDSQAALPLLSRAMTGWLQNRQLDDVTCPLLHALACMRTGDSGTAAKSLEIVEEVMTESDSRRFRIFVLMVREEVLPASSTLQTAMDELENQSSSFNDASLRRAFLEDVYLHRDLKDRWEALQKRSRPPRLHVRLARADAPLGRALTDAEQVRVKWTLDAGAADRELIARAGRVGLRRHRILRLLAEAADQGAAASDEDLAFALDVSRRTILRDIRALKAEGISIQTRGRH